MLVLHSNQINMKKIILPLVIFISSLSLIFAQDGKINYQMTSVSSGSSVQSTPLLDVGIFSGGVFSIDPANDSGIQNLVQTAFDLLIGITIALSVIMFMVGAFEGILNPSVTGNMKGKEKMKNSLYSLVFVLSSWLIINTINPDLLNLPAFSFFNNTVVGNRQTPGTNAVLLPVTTP